MDPSERSPQRPGVIDLFSPIPEVWFPCQTPFRTSLPSGAGNTPLVVSGQSTLVIKSHGSLSRGESVVSVKCNSGKERNLR